MQPHVLESSMMSEESSSTWFNTHELTFGVASALATALILRNHSGTLIFNLDTKTGNVVNAISVTVINGIVKKVIVITSTTENPHPDLLLLHLSV